MKHIYFCFISRPFDTESLTRKVVTKKLDRDFIFSSGTLEWLACIRLSTADTRLEFVDLLTFEFG